MTDLIADKSYMYGEMYDPNEIDILEIVEYDFRAETMYKLDSMLFLSLWRIISDYVEDVKHVTFEIWKLRGQSDNSRYCNWFGEYTFGTSNTTAVYSNKIWLTNKSGWTFKNLSNDNYGYKENVLHDVCEQFNSALPDRLDYDSKKRAFGFAVEGFHCVGDKVNYCHNMENLLQAYLTSPLDPHISIFSISHTICDRDPKSCGVNVAFIKNIDELCREVDWIYSIGSKQLDIDFHYGRLRYQKS